MKFRLEPKPPVDKTQWHKWFAWYPVRIGNYLFWLQQVDRKGMFHEDSAGGSWSYEYQELVVYY